MRTYAAWDTQASARDSSHLARSRATGTQRAPVPENGVLQSVALALPAKRAPDRPALALQAKLTIGPPGDAHEQEADRVAEQVVNMAEPRGGASGSRGGTETTGLLRAKAAGPTPVATMAVPPIVHDVLSSPGRPLDTATRAFMEPRFGEDFGDVRLHTGDDAAKSAAAIDARAYTVGSHVVLGAGGADRLVMAHELTHVAQQRQAAQTIRRFFLPPVIWTQPAKYILKTIEPILITIETIKKYLNGTFVENLTPVEAAALVNYVFEVLDATRVLLFATRPDPRHPRATAAAAVWEKHKTPLRAGEHNIKVADSTETPKPIMQAMEVQQGKLDFPQGQPRDWWTGAQVEADEGTGGADSGMTSMTPVWMFSAWLYDYLNKGVFPAFKRKPALLRAAQAVVQGRARDALAKLTALGIANKTSGAATPFDLNKMTWQDVLDVWFYELGPADMGNSRTNPLKFGPKAWTTHQIRVHPAMGVIGEYARLRADVKQATLAAVKIPMANNTDSFRAQSKYNVTALKLAVPARDLTWTFLGSYEVSLKSDFAKNQVSVSVYNASSWESATRFVKNPDPKINTGGVVPNKLRGEGPIRAGGTLHCTWDWNEPLRLPPVVMAPLKDPQERYLAVPDKSYVDMPVPQIPTPKASAQKSPFVPNANPIWWPKNGPF